MMPLYTPCRRADKSADPMRVFVFFSGGASSLAAMLDDPNHGSLYKVVGAYSDTPGASGEELCSRRNVNHFPLDRKKTYRDMKLRGPDGREEFYRILAHQVSPFNPDLICLSGYMHLVSDGFVDLYANRILNVHPATLSILSNELQRTDASGLSAVEAKNLIKHCGFKRKLTGKDAVRGTIMQGERETRSTVHILDKGVDTGPIVTQSKAFEIDLEALERDGIEKYKTDLQGRMKTEGDGPAYLKALELISQGRVAIDGSELFLDGRPLPYCGVRLTA